MTKKAILISIRPKWCEMIANGKKTVEVRKTRPRLEPPFKCYVYCTQSKRPYDDFISFVTEEGAVGFYGGGKVIGEFICDGIVRIYYEQFDDAKDENDGFYQWWDSTSDWARNLDTKSCLTSNDFHDYLGTKGGCAWHISDLKIYDTQKKLSKFSLKRPPQSWCYVEELEGADHAQE